MFQNKLLYFPVSATIEEMAVDGLNAWPDAGNFRGLLAEPTGTPRATAIVFHGNAGHAGHRQFYAEQLLPLGIRVILAEYPGYGPRGGELGETSFLADARQTVALVQQRYQQPVVIIGESLGAGIAAGAWQGNDVSGILLITPWDRLENVARHHYPFLPVTWLLRDPYDSVTHLSGLAKPVLVVVAGEDTIIPPAFGHALFEKLPSPKRLSQIDKAGHNDWFYRLDDSWWRQALDFLLADSSPLADRR
ncbi:MAG TPA: alpha/beta fold hydrolase [Accumulibacter sp.]|nr:alpha/beta fold hydrolase [Accumulibacter sp.]HNJ99441.1 alpha/beta fold hydrolase [Accumulibacter sp.]HNL12588.1 alpha/beta fold hydrolase [Accumulibacter sp.]